MTDLDKDRRDDGRKPLQEPAARLLSQIAGWPPVRILARRHAERRTAAPPGGRNPAADLAAAARVGVPWALLALLAALTTCVAQSWLATPANSSAVIADAWDTGANALPLGVIPLLLLLGKVLADRIGRDALALDALAALASACVLGVAGAINMWAGWARFDDTAAPRPLWMALAAAAGIVGSVAMGALIRRAGSDRPTASAALGLARANLVGSMLVLAAAGLVAWVPWYGWDALATLTLATIMLVRAFLIGRDSLLALSAYAEPDAPDTLPSRSLWTWFRAFVLTAAMGLAEQVSFGIFLIGGLIAAAIGVPAVLVVALPTVGRVLGVVGLLPLSTRFRAPRAAAFWLAAVAVVFLAMAPIVERGEFVLVGLGIAFASSLNNAPYVMWNRMNAVIRGRWAENVPPFLWFMWILLGTTWFSVLAGDGPDVGVRMGKLFDVFGTAMLVFAGVVLLMLPRIKAMPERARWRDAFTPLRERDFRRVWWSALLSGGALMSVDAFVGVMMVEAKLTLTQAAFTSVAILLGAFLMLVVMAVVEKGRGRFVAAALITFAGFPIGALFESALGVGMSFAVGVVTLARLSIETGTSIVSTEAPRWRAGDPAVMASIQFGRLLGQCLFTIAGAVTALVLGRILSTWLVLMLVGVIVALVQLGLALRMPREVKPLPALLSGGLWVRDGLELIQVIRAGTTAAAAVAAALQPLPKAVTGVVCALAERARRADPAGLVIDAQLWDTVRELAGSPAAPFVGFTADASGPVCVIGVGSAAKRSTADRIANAVVAAIPQLHVIVGPLTSRPEGGLAWYVRAGDAIARRIRQLDRRGGDGGHDWSKLAFGRSATNGRVMLAGGDDHDVVTVAVRKPRGTEAPSGLPDYTVVTRAAALLRRLVDSGDVRLVPHEGGHALLAVAKLPAERLGWLAQQLAPELQESGFPCVLVGRQV